MINKVSRQAIFVLSLGILSSGTLYLSVGQGQDNPDEAVEKRFHEIYEKYNSHPISSSEWAKISGTKQSEIYIIQPGDTLWDISTTFFGSGFFWPKLWQLNDEITNPHEIAPGKKLKFTPGDLGDAPQLSVEDEQVDEDVAAEEEEEEPEQAEDSEVEPMVVQAENGHLILPDSRRKHPVLMKIPPSLPGMTGVNNLMNYNVNGFNLEKEVPQKIDPLSAVPMFLTVETPETAGTVFGFEMDSDTGALWQLATIRGHFRVGDRLTAVSIDRTAKDILDGQNIGTVYFVEGELVVTSGIPNEPDLFEARIIKSVNPVHRNAILLKGHLPTYNASVDTKPTKSSTHIAAVNYDKRKIEVGPGTIVFLAEGREIGLAQGQILPIYRNPKIRTGFDRHIIEPLGRLKVIHTTSSRATGVVLDSNNMILAGDFVGAPADIAAQIAKTRAEEATRGDDDAEDSGSDSESDTID